MQTLRSFIAFLALRPVYPGQLTILCIIGSDDFTRGTADNLRNLFNDKLAERYIRKN